MAKLMPETTAIIQTIATFPSPNQPLDTAIDTRKFQSLYKILHEKKSSSVSGRHIGHYKAAVLSDDLSTIFTSMMHIPHLVGFSPRRWQQVVDVMLEKSAGNSKIHRL
jgi:hypothetical protein